MNQAQANIQQDQSSRQKRKQIFMLFLIIFSLIICAIISVLTVLKHQIQPEPLPANPTEAIRAACNVTTYYSSCIKSVSSLHNPSHKLIHTSDVFRLSIGAALHEFHAIHQLPQELASKNENSNIRPILTDCQNLFNLSLDQLNRSLIMITENQIGLDEETWDYHDEGMMKDLRDLTLQAKTNVERCVEGLEANETTGQREIVEIENAKERIQQAVIYMVNGLDVLENKDLTRELLDSSSWSVLALLVLKENYVITIAFGSQYLFLVILVGFFLRVFV